MSDDLSTSGFTERLEALPEWALLAASNILNQLEDESTFVLYRIPSSRKIRLTCEIGEALIACRSDDFKQWVAELRKNHGELSTRNHE